jgi:uracil-DNA glycosylase
LPSPNLATWNYADWSKLPWLRSRQAYEQSITKQRILLLRQKIDACQPRVVIFYGDGQLKHWRQIMGAGTYARPITDKLIAHERDDIAFFVTRHPADPMLGPRRDDYFREIGRYFRDTCGARFLCRM